MVTDSVPYRNTSLPVSQEESRSKNTPLCRRKPLHNPVHLDDVTEEVRVRKKSSGHEVNVRKVNGEDHPQKPKPANIDVTKEMQALRIVLELKILLI
ncbi:hypothetical protein B9Z55_022066 [Caenorhabditis nigoni]|uniref:Uncharacterized protein n=1 Tax=Caenorhabditis nigoni TaxID=1611254 RepID=A0A2G5TUN0_9PELO|nr:hypothetical protein B9Z55_022066 [Caenorhabditis nigoni]